MFDPFRERDPFLDRILAAVIVGAITVSILAVLAYPMFSAPLPRRQLDYSLGSEMKMWAEG